MHRLCNKMQFEAHQSVFHREGNCPFPRKPATADNGGPSRVLEYEKLSGHGILINFL